MNMDKILFEVKAKRDFIAHILLTTPYWPGIVCKGRKDFDGRNELYLSTVVRIKRNGKWYGIHHVECFMQNDNLFISLHESHMRLVKNVVMSQHLYELRGMEPEDTIQIDETERIKKLYVYHPSNKGT